jgi:hypothetical protein
MEENKEYNQLHSTEISSEVDTERSEDLEKNPLESLEIKFKLMNAPERKVQVAISDLNKKNVGDLKKLAFDNTNVRLIYQGKLMLDSTKLSEFSKYKSSNMNFFYRF